MPTDLNEQARIMREFIAQGEANGRVAFRPETYGITPEGPTLVESHSGWLLGHGSEYNFYNLPSGKTIATFTPSGPWPHASVSWVLGEYDTHAEAVMTITFVEYEVEGGDKSALRDLLTRLAES